MSELFAEFNLHPQLVQAIVDAGYTTPTDIQMAVIPALMSGADVIGQSHTGSGKTAAFALPLLHNLDPEANYVQALVLAPTRELAIQVSDAIQKYGQHAGARVLTVYGGQDYRDQMRPLKQKRVDVVVGTPGRIIDLIDKGSLDLSQVHYAVLDEADEMLSMGFIDDIEKILSKLPEERQTALFSATMPAEIRRLAAKYLRDPQSSTIAGQQRTVDTIEQRYYVVNENDKLAATTRLFETEKITSALIFARTREATGQIANELTNRGFPAEALNGDLSQQARERVLGRFQDGRLKVLVATDIAARGLDIDHISHVFNFDLPQYPDSYVHRVGRTGRAGKSGVAISLVTPAEQWRLHKIEAYTRQKLTPMVIPSEIEIQTQRETELMERMMVWLVRGRCHKERAAVLKLVEEGHDAVEIAAAALKLAQGEEKQRPIAPLQIVAFRSERDRRPDRTQRNVPKRSSRYQQNGPSDAPNHPSRRSFESGMVRLRLNVGRAQGVRVNDIVGAIASQSQISSKSIGAIKIQDDCTFIDIADNQVGQVLAANTEYRMGRLRATLSRA